MITYVHNRGSIVKRIKVHSSFFDDIRWRKSVQWNDNNAVSSSLSWLNLPRPTMREDLVWSGSAGPNIVRRVPGLVSTGYLHKPSLTNERPGRVWADQWGARLTAGLLVRTSGLRGGGVTWRAGLGGGGGDKTLQSPVTRATCHTPIIQWWPDHTDTCVASSHGARQSSKMTWGSGDDLRFVISKPEDVNQNHDHLLPEGRGELHRRGLHQNPLQVEGRLIVTCLYRNRKII